MGPASLAPMRLLSSGLVVAASAALLAAAAGAGTEADLRIRLGQGIGKLRLGMSEAEVRRAMGRPRAIVRLRADFGILTVEYQYGLAAYAVRLSGPRGRLRATRISTVLRRERTAKGIGPGSRERDLIRAYRRVRCKLLPTARIGGVLHVVASVHSRTCALATPSGRTTIFTTQVPFSAIFDPPRPLETWLKTARISEVAVAEGR
jgi:hypothetical protein